MRSVLSLLVVMCIEMGAATAQECPDGIADAVPTIVADTVPWPPDVAFTVARSALEQLGYTLVREDPEAGVLRSAPLFDQSEDRKPQAFRAFASPGVEVAVILQPVPDTERPWRAPERTVVVRATRALCNVLGAPTTVLGLSLPDAYEAAENRAVFNTMSFTYLSGVGLGSAEPSGPERLNCPEPVFPSALPEEAFIEAVPVTFVIDSTGRVDPNTVRIDVSVDLRVARVVRDIVGQCRFRPGIVNGQPVNVLGTMDVTFRRRR